MEKKTVVQTLFQPKNDFWKWFVPSVVVAVVGFIIAYQFVEPAPPRSFTLASGREGGWYHAYATRYREALAAYGIDVRLVETAGTVENLALLGEEGGADLAFVQSGVASPGAEDDRVSVASLYFEPFWIFYRGEPGDRLADLDGKRIAVGAEGSGTRALALRLLKDGGVTAETARLLPLSGDRAAEALEAGEVDAGLFVISPRAPLVTRLLGAEGVRLMSLRNAEALHRRHRYLSVLTLEEGVIDPSGPLPARDVRLLSPAATLVARGDFHPALTDLLLDVAGKVHGEGSWLSEPGAFPSPLYVDFPLADVSKDFFENGRRFLRRVLPFWAATLVNRLKVLLLPLLTLAFPLVKLVPPLYKWRIRARINKWYSTLQRLEAEVPPDERAERIEEVLKAIQRIEAEVAKVQVPASYGDNLYQLRFHTSIARQKLEALKEGGSVNAE